MAIQLLRGSIIATVESARRHTAAVLVVALLVAGGGVLYASRHLGIDTNTNDLFAASLPWRQAALAESRNFPQFDNVLVGVVRGATPEEAAETAQALAAAVNADKAHFHDATVEGAGAFYDREGLLLLPVPKLAALLNQIVAAQPFIGQLAADPSARGLFGGLGLLAQGASQGGADLSAYDKPLTAIAATIAAAAQGRQDPLSWQALLGGGLAQSQRFVLIHPVLDHSKLEPGGVATAALVRLADQLPDIRAGRASFAYTGQIPLSDEQFASLTQGLVLGAVVALALIILWLFLALRSVRLIIAVLLTLAFGLAYTLTFAAVAIGTLNLISVAFAILFVGLAVDFAIQFCVRYRDVGLRLGDSGRGYVLAGTAREAGGQIALAATATACGFLAFAPTPFLGVAELGIIAGAGMIIAFVCTITILPALLMAFRARVTGAAVALPFGHEADDFLARYRRPVLGAFAVLAIAGLVAAIYTPFDANPLHTKDPNQPAMRTLRSLQSAPETDPFYADMLVPDLAAARALSARLAALPEVAMVLSGATFVPQDQSTKLAMIAQAQSILAPTLGAPPVPAPPDVADLRLAMKSAEQAIAAAAPKLPPHAPLLAIGKALAALQGAPDADVLAADLALTRFLPAELAQLNEALAPQPITAANLPDYVRRDWFSPDGRVRVEALPTKAARSTQGLKRFVRAVRGLAPDAGGPAVSIIATATTVLHAFRTAAILAALAITAILLIVFRNLRDTARVLMTLGLSALLTALFARILGLGLNFANIIALPLLLGVGVSFNVYFVMNARAGMRRFLGSASARAILFSALTTGTAFGSLAASHDRGTASMGILLLISLFAVLVGSFVFLPTLLLSGRAGPSDDAGKTQP